jgi:hypothetical protein
VGGAAIAGALAAIAVTFLVIALGSGIGLSFASPYSSGPSAKTMTIAAAIWLLMAQTMGFATGGYLAGRLRSPAYDGVIGETTFRDAAEGMLVWAIGVVAMAALAGLLGLFANDVHGAGHRYKPRIVHTIAAIKKPAETAWNDICHQVSGKSVRLTSIMLANIASGRTGE